MNNLVSICIPNYNMSYFIGDCINSAVNQTYSNLEIIVIDNNSTDDSWKIINSFQNNKKKYRCYKNDTNIGMVRNWNKCIKYAKGEFLTILSADDLLEPTFIEECMKVRYKFNNLGYVFTEWNNINEFGEILKRRNFYVNSAIIKGYEEARINIIGSHTIPSAMLIKKSSLEEIGGYDGRYDWCFDMGAKIKLNLHFDVGYIKKRLVKYRVHSGMSSSYYRKTKLGVMEIYKMKSLILNNLSKEKKSLLEYRDEMINNLAKMCVSFAETSILEDNITLAKEYLYLAFSFNEEIKENILCKLLIFYFENKKHLSNRNYLEIKKMVYSYNSQRHSDANPPYKLPEGSLILNNI